MSTLRAEITTQTHFAGFAPNLFEVSLFGEDSTDPTNKVDIADKESLSMDNMTFEFPNGTKNVSRFFCTAYELPAPALSFKQDPYTKKHYVEKYAIPEQVTITWQEDRNLSVWNYHKNWFDCFYNRSTDVFRVGFKGKKRTAHILIQRYPGLSANGGTPALPTNMIEGTDLKELLTIRLIGLVPKSIPPLKGSWSDDAEKGTLNIVISYSVDYIAITQDGDNSFLGAI